MKYYGYYSAHADRQFGHCLYKTPDGLVIKITEVTSKDKPFGRWNDYVCLGEVTDYIKSNTVKLSATPEVLLELCYAAIAVEKKCQEQFPRTGKCFCFTCPLKNSSN